MFFTKKRVAGIVIVALLAVSAILLSYAQEKDEYVEMPAFEKLEKAKLFLEEAREAYIKAQKLTRSAVEEVAREKGMTICDICKTCDALPCCEIECCPQPCIKVTESLEKAIELMPRLVETLRNI